MKLKVIFITQNDPFYTKFFFDEFLKVYPEIDYQLVKVVFFSPMKDSVTKLIKRTKDFYGPLNFLRLGHKYVYTKVAEKIGLPVTAFNMLKRRGISVEKVDTVNSREFIKYVKSEKIDLIVSISAPQIFKEKLLEAPRKAAINIHSGKIPAYRGLFPNFWQMYNGEKNSTVTIHEMQKEIDKGSIISETEVPIATGETLTQLIKKTKTAAVHSLNEVISRYSKGKVKTYENTNVKPSYYKFPGKDDVRRFKQKGLRII